MKKYLLLTTSLSLSIGLVACESETPKEKKKETAQAIEKALSEKDKILKSMDEHRKNKDKAETFVILEESKKTAVDQAMYNDLVKDAAMQIGDNFVRNLGGFAGGKGPERYYGTKI
ncbi:hypothetical protein CON22_24765 [Bacillus cereus]|nr:hypothetical protein CON22_24765 [Bacillus cereus]